MGACCSRADKVQPARDGDDDEAGLAAARDAGFRAQLVRHEKIKAIEALYDVGQELGRGMSGAVHIVHDKRTRDK